MMELFIETLTGAAFELRVSPFETIMSVKAKIQRLEGIPISQQHLTWHHLELEDDYCLHDYSIHDGATLKLVLAMRGGPINTRRIPMDDPALREMAEYVESNRDEIWEKLPGNRQVTVLVFREGDQFNFFRVVDRGDGNLTPLSESLSGTSLYNLNDEEEEEEVVVQPPEKIEENDKLKEKMKQLRVKMEKLNVNKKPVQASTSKATLSVGARARRRHIPSASLYKGHSLNKNTCLPPVGQTFTSQTSKEERATSSSDNEELNFNSSDGDTSPEQNILTNPLNKLSCIATSSTSTLTESATSPVSRIPVMTAGASGAVSSPPSGSLSRLDSLVTEPMSDSGGGGSRISGLPIPASLRDHQEKYARGLDAARRTADVGVDTLSHLPSMSSWKHEGKKDNDVLSCPPSASTRKDYSLESLKETLGRAGNKYNSHLKRQREFTLENLSSSEARAVSGLLRQASIERIGGTSRLGGLRLENFSGTLLQDGRVVTPEGRLVSARLRVSAGQEGKLSPTHHRRLPPVKAKKKKVPTATRR